MLNKIRTHLVQNAAQILRTPAQLLPNDVQNKLLLEALRKVFQESLQDDDFDFLADKWLRITIIDLHISWFISYQADNLVVSQGVENEDVSFSGSLNDLVLIAGRKEDPDTLFFQRRLKIEGDTELGLEVKNLMDSVDLDALPKPLKVVVDHLAEFVYQGMQSQQQPKPGAVNAY